MAIYDIDLLRSIFVDKLNDNTIFLASFYEQIEDNESISRYVANIKDMIALQNQEKSVSNYKAMGVISQSGSAEILNIKTNYVSPLEYNVRFDIELTDRDYVLDKIKTLIDNTRGNKFDIALRANGTAVVFNQPTTFNLTHTLPVAFTKAYIPYSGGNPSTANNFFAGLKNHLLLTKNTQNLDLTIYFVYASIFYSTVYKHTGWTTAVTNLTAYDDTIEQAQATIDTIANTGTLNTLLSTFINASGRTHRGVLRITATDTAINHYYAISLTTETRTTPTNLGATPEFYKVSLSFNGIQSDEPFLNNGIDRVFVFFGGSATIVKDNVALGNDIVKTTIQVGKDTGTIYDVEPLEIPSSLSLNDDTYQVYSGGFQSVDRNMAIQNKLNYTFVYDRANALFNDLYKFSRYGSGASTYTNLIFTIKEYRYSLGVLLVDSFYAKLSESGVQNTNGDVLTLTLSFKVGAY